MHRERLTVFVALALTLFAPSISRGQAPATNSESADGLGSPRAPTTSPIASSDSSNTPTGAVPPPPPSTYESSPGSREPYVPRYNTNWNPDWGGMYSRPNPARFRHRIWGELGFYSGTLPGGFGDNPITVGTLAVAATIRPSRSFRVSARWPIAFGSVDTGGTNQETLRVGNPFVGLFHTTPSRRLDLYVGGGLTLPIASVPDDTDRGITALATLDRAAAMEGAASLWLWRPSSMAVLLKSGVDWADDIIWGTEVTLGPLIDIDIGTLDMLLVASGYVGFEIDDVFQSGLRASLSFFSGDRTQFALTPFVELTTDLYLHLRLVMNLNSPAGFAFNENGVWGLHIGGGGQL